MSDAVSSARCAWLRWVPVLAWAAFLAAAVAWAHTGTLPRVFAWVGRQPGGDKIGHFVLVGVLTFLLDHALAGRSYRGVPLSAILVGVVMTAEEFSQLGSTTRAFEWADLVANYSGIAAGLLLLRTMRRKKRKTGEN